ncbi:phosphotransferase family protein [Halovenus halobia]|uniref:phosphotransferase family protein n=1 Tax=Halovenus halobia TaxID=3396622 RepID=UPI003F565389
MNDQNLDSILGDVRPAATVTGTTALDRGNRKETTVVRFADADPVVVQRAADSKTIQTEARLLGEIADRTTIPVARPLSSNNGWLVTPYIPGEDLHVGFVDHSTAQQDSLAKQFGNGLAQLHEAFVFDQSGSLSVIDGELSVVPDTSQVGGGLELVAGSSTQGPQGWFTRLGEAAVTRLPEEFDGLKPQLRSLVAHPPTDRPTPRLFPWDFRPGNALVNEAELAAVLDWEGPLAADPALSYAKAEYLIADWYVPRERAERLRTAFRRGYETVRDVPAPAAAHRVTAIASTAVDSRGQVTNPKYPPVDREAAVEFHREALRRALAETDR